MRELKTLLLATLAVAMIIVTPVAAAADDPPEVLELWLVDAASDTRIQRLEEFTTLRMPMLPSELSVEAVANGATESVLMRIEGTPSSVENLEPYALRGDASGDFNPAPEFQVPGWLDVSAQPFAGPDNTGTAGAELEYHLFLHQPDFVVRNPADIGDYNPGDGVCSIGPVAYAANTLAVVPLDQVSDTERKLIPDLSASGERKVTADTPKLQIDEIFDAAFVDSEVELFDFDISTIDLADILGGQLIDSLDLLPNWWLTGCTLRAAIEEANALPGKQSIIIDSAKGPFNLSKGQLSITGPVDVIGHGDRALIDADRRSRIFHIAGDHIVNFRSLDLARGRVSSTDRGGAIFISENALLQMSDSVVRESRANFGGGIYLQSGGDLTLTDSAIRDNIAGTPESFGGGGVTQRGGGIYNLKGNVTIRDSAIFDNVAVRGGGLSNSGGRVRIENSSVIDNEAKAIAGGIENRHNGDTKGVLHLSFATVAHNLAGTSTTPPAEQRVGGGLYNTGWAFLASSILADNTDAYSAANPLHAPDCYSPDQYDFKSYRNNVVGVLNTNCDLGDYFWGDARWFQFGSETSPLDPQLLSPQFWGHRKYRMIGTNSPAVDAGATASASLYPCPDNDGRDRARPVGDGCDIGAIERQ